MKYIFIAGAPGSKWSSVSKNIYYSPNIDNTDYSKEREYYHTAWGETNLMHMGAYFDPGMEFGDFFDNLDRYSIEECEAEFDRPFSGEGVRIIKSHVFCNHIDFIKQTWPDCPILLVYRDNDACLGWWVRCGHFNITYPLYHKYYKDLVQMGYIINEQNAGLVKAQLMYSGANPNTNLDLCELLNIEPPPKEYFQDYAASDIRLTVI